LLINHVVAVNATVDDDDDDDDDDDALFRH
jgi:hypothetical protein